MLRFEQVDPRTLTANPANWRLHPPEQVRTAEALIFGADGMPAEVGWADAVRFNERTGKLLDGHMRVKIAADRGEPFVPVLIGDWSEEQERKILATHDTLGLMAEIDGAAFTSLIADMQVGADVQALLDSVKAAADLMPPAEATTDEAGDTEKQASPAQDKEAVPDALWASDNTYDVPSLLLELAGNAVDFPVTTWGSIGHTRAMRGTYHFYTADRRFDPLWSNPGKVLLSGCPSVVEPNFSTSEQTPFTVALWHIFRKRWLARFWQSKGVRIFVDINVHASLLEPHEALGGLRPIFLGVPKGWGAYATRSHGNDPRLIDREYDAAAAHSGLETIPLFLVIGGGKAIKEHCGERGWVWVAEAAETSRSKTDASDI